MPDRPETFGRKRPACRSGGSLAKRDTSAAYKRQRLAILSAEPLCRYCFNQGRITAATILDHIIALSLDGNNEAVNLAPACEACNSAKGVDEQRFIARGYDVRDLPLDPALAEWLRLASSSFIRS